jgi:hypothetical protein
VQQLAAHRVQLHVLDDDRAGLAVDLQVDQRAGADQHPAQLAGVGAEADAAAVRRAVDDAGDLPAPAQAAGNAGAELLALADIDSWTVGGHDDRRV